MIRIAVHSDCDESIVDALTQTDQICVSTADATADALLYDVLIVDWRRHPDLYQMPARHPFPSGLPLIAVIEPRQAIPYTLPGGLPADLVSIDDLGSTAFLWRLQRMLTRYNRPLTLSGDRIPEIQLLHDVVDHLRDWVIIKDLDHRFLIVSDDFADTVGLPKAQIIGRNDLEIGTSREAVLGNPDTGWQGFWAQDDEVLESGVAACEENLEWRAFSVGRRHKRTVRVPLRNAKGSIHALLVVVSDITDRVLAERNLQARNLMLRRVTEEKLNAQQHRRLAEHAINAKNSFLAAASHDLRQPLHALGLFLAVLERRISDEANLEILQKIRHSCEALNALFSSLLDISRLDAGVVEVTARTFSLRELLTSLRDEFMQLGSALSLQVSVQIVDTVIHTDPVLFGRILRNLLQNAITHTRAGSVQVSCRETDDGLCISVSDTGPGIPELQCEAIFSEYYQLESTTSQPVRGMGLGLAIVRKMAQLLEVDVAVHSVVGEGSTFSVTVPLGEPQDLEVSGTPVLDQHLAGHNILCIDDEPEIREGLALILDACQCRTIVAESADQALLLLEALDLQPDAMIVDYQLRDGYTGNAAIVAVRNHFKCWIPAVIVTGDTSDSSLRKARQSGCTLLHKPVDALQLVKTLAAVLETSLATS